MEIIREWPTWAIVLVGLFGAAVLIALNVTWLLAAKKSLDARTRASPDDDLGRLTRAREQLTRRRPPDAEPPPTPDGPPASPRGGSTGGP